MGILSVVGTPIGNLGEFPSGQRGQTVNLLLILFTVYAALYQACPCIIEFYKMVVLLVAVGLDPCYYCGKQFVRVSCAFEYCFKKCGGER